MFVVRDDAYLDFDSQIVTRNDIKDLIEADSGVLAIESAVNERIGLWWEAEEPRFDKLQSVADLVDLRREFMNTFHAALEATPLLDRFAISGVIASWWGKSLPDLKALATIGYQGLVEAWVATVLDALDEEKSRINPLGHKVARALLPEYLESLADLQSEVMELDSLIKGATAPVDDDGDEVEPEEAALSPSELKALKSKLSAAKRKLKLEKGAFGSRLVIAAEALDNDASRQVVLDALESDLFAEADDRISRHRRSVIHTFETWWDKYQIPLSVLEGEREAAAAAMAEFLAELGYE